MRSYKGLKEEVRGAFHVSSGTVLNGQYPGGVIEWPAGEWKIGVPAGKFGTFNLVPGNPEIRSAEFFFVAPRVLVGFDICNDGATEATVTVRADGSRVAAYKVKSGEIQRVRTGWRDATARVALEFGNGQALRFDNLAYQHP